ncbi:glutamate racemase [Salinispirillum sp. LH 10-3-1]|uniref:Glutamate racemase n=1 Tax=Salinispirillum sp. LH 10-3-1 TaxID=2952525 RepID=A0AB38YIK6_9GAMM
MNNAAIGVFDSGLGGLTVLAELRRRLPAEDMIYLGDTARVPYGTKSQASVTQYALQVAKKLRQQDIKMLVVACNTASALALPAIQAALPDLPIVGVVNPGAQRAVCASATGHIGVIATEGTILRGAYTDAIQALRADAVVTGKACSLFVSLVEEGWVDGALVTEIVRTYLEPLQALDPAIDTLVLGCTHYPVLRPVIAKIMGPDVTLVDSALTTAEVVSERLRNEVLACSPGRIGHTEFQVTDGPERFARVAGIFLGDAVGVQDVHLVDL